MDEVGLWVSPVVLVSGVGLLILSTSARYGQMHAELRELLHDTNDGKLADEPANMLYQHLRNRTHLLLSALFGLYLSIGFLVTATLVGALGTLWTMSQIPVVALTCAGILGIAFAALQLIRESRLFLHTVDACGHQMTGMQDDVNSVRD
jgi:hypothetical protein